MNQINLDRRIVCAANKCDEYLLLGPRHWDDTMRKQYSFLKEMLGKDTPPYGLFTQGFINTWGEFLSRKDAWMVACHNDQILNLVGGNRIEDLGVYGTNLYSENLY